MILNCWQINLERNIPIAPLPFDNLDFHFETTRNQLQGSVVTE